MTENEVVDSVERWLTQGGWTVGGACRNTQRGDDLAAVLGDGSRLYVECKGAVSLHGNDLDSWKNAAMAVFGAIKDTEELRPGASHAIAVPDTQAYRRTIGGLNDFFVRQRVSIFWVLPDGRVQQEGAPIAHTRGRG